MPLVWLVTGTSTGIGRAFIPAVLARGDKVIATSRNTCSLESLQWDNPDSVRVLPLDVTSPQDQIEKAVEQAIAVWGKVDVVVNNAGYSQVGTWEDISYVLILANLTLFRNADEYFKSDPRSCLRASTRMSLALTE